MTLSKYTTKELIDELHLRAERVDKILAAVATANIIQPSRSVLAVGRSVTANGSEPPKLKGRVSRVLKGNMVMDCLGAAKGPMSARQIHRRLRKGTIAAIHAQLHRLKLAEKVKCEGELPNVVWSALTGR